MDCGGFVGSIYGWLSAGFALYLLGLESDAGLMGERTGTLFTSWRVAPVERVYNPLLDSSARTPESASVI